MLSFLFKICASLALEPLKNINRWNLSMSITYSSMTPSFLVSRPSFSHSICLIVSTRTSCFWPSNSHRKWRWNLIHVSCILTEFTASLNLYKHCSGQVHLKMYGRGEVNKMSDPTSPLKWKHSLPLSRTFLNVTDLRKTKMKTTCNL